MFAIGDLEFENRLIMAPMAGITNPPFRLMARRFGAALVFTEMISAVGLKLHQKKTLAYLRSVPDEKPLAVQIFGADPDVMAAAAGLAVESGADIVDINMGCPVKKVTKTGAGASLMRDPKKVERLVAAVRAACPVPLTAKIRAGWSPESPNACEIARIIEGCGGDAVTVHPRFATQGYRGQADWTFIAEAKKAVRVPVIGNGDILRPADAPDMRRRTGCDGMMIGRAAARNPWIFRQILQLEKGLPVDEPDPAERRRVILEHYSLLSDFMGEHRASLCMRGLLLRYTKGLPGSCRFREKASRIKDTESLVSIMDDYFQQLDPSARFSAAID